MALHLTRVFMEIISSCINDICNLTSLSPRRSRCAHGLRKNNRIGSLVLDGFYIPFAAARNYPPPCQRGKLRQISYIAECRNFESNGEPEFVLSMFGLRLVTFQKRRAKRLRDSPYHWHLGDNYFQRSRGSILA